MSPHSWAAQEITTPDLGDGRLSKRRAVLLEPLAAHPAQSLPQACGTWADTKAAYRFMASPQVTPRGIRDAHPFPVLSHRSKVFGSSATRVQSLSPPKMPVFF